MNTVITNNQWKFLTQNVKAAFLATQMHLANVSDSTCRILCEDGGALLQAAAIVGSVGKGAVNDAVAKEELMLAKLAAGGLLSFNGNPGGKVP